MSKTHLASQCIAAIRSGQSVTDVSKKFKVSRATLYAWGKKYKKEKKDSYDNVEIHPRVKMYPANEEVIASLEKKCLEQENQYRELLSVSTEELKAAKESIDMLIEMLKSAVTWRFRPRYGGKPDFE